MTEFFFLVILGEYFEERFFLLRERSSRSSCEHKSISFNHQAVSRVSPLCSVHVWVFLSCPESSKVRDWVTERHFISSAFLFFAKRRKTLMRKFRWRRNSRHRLGNANRNHISERKEKPTQNREPRASVWHVLQPVGQFTSSLGPIRR